MNEVLEEERRFDAFDSPMSPNPYSPYAVADRLVAPEAVPFLITCLDGRHRGQKWAVRALDKLGPAARAASARLEAIGETLALWSVDELRARELGVHLHAGTWRDYKLTARHAIARRAVDAGPERARMHFTELLASDDVEVLRWALDAISGDSSSLYDLAWNKPDAVPIEAVRPHARHGSTKVAGPAARILMTLHHPVDADAVLDVLARTTLERIDYQWLAPHPRSHELYESARARDTFELVRRRRCAGLPAELSAERFAARKLQDAEDRKFVPRVLAELVGAVATPATIEAADDRFLVSHLEDHMPDAGAYGHYARVLLADPTHAHAAFQLAWIDRHYGSPITEARITWLRTLGVREDSLLADLATPRTTFLSGYRARHQYAPGTQDEALAHLSRVWDATRR